jgi:hypothetical protein
MNGYRSLDSSFLGCFSQMGNFLCFNRIGLIFLFFYFHGRNVLVRKEEKAGRRSIGVLDHIDWILCFSSSYSIVFVPKEAEETLEGRGGRGGG